MKHFHGLHVETAGRKRNSPSPFLLLVAAEALSPQRLNFCYLFLFFLHTKVLLLKRKYKRASKLSNCLLNSNLIILSCYTSFLVGEAGSLLHNLCMNNLDARWRGDSNLDWQHFKDCFLLEFSKLVHLRCAFFPCSGMFVRAAGTAVLTACI